jgi:hypothetical protein
MDMVSGTFMVVLAGVILVLIGKMRRKFKEQEKKDNLLWALQNESMDFVVAIAEQVGIYEERQGFSLSAREFSIEPLALTVGSILHHVNKVTIYRQLADELLYVYTAKELKQFLSYATARHQDVASMLKESLRQVREEQVQDNAESAKQQAIRDGFDALGIESESAI